MDNNTYELLKNETLRNTQYINVKHINTYERFEVIEGTYKGKEFKVSYGKEYGHYTYDIKFGEDKEIAELMQVLVVMGIIEIEVAEEWADLTINKIEENLRFLKSMKVAQSRILL